jgi:ribosomal protein S18 acetylase RimI-like enzyme
LEYLCIDAKVQRSGAGTALVDIVRKDASDRLIWLEASATPSAVNFYKKLHFEDLGRFPVGDLTYTAMKLEPSISQ